MMYYALTIRGDLITGVHSSTEPFTPDQFERNPKLAGDIVMPFESGEYKTGHDLREYVDGKLRPLVDRILDSLASVPNGYEVVDGQLVKIDAPIEAQPQSIRQRIEDADARIAALEEELKKLKPTITTLALDVVGLKQIEKPTSVKSK